MDVHQNRTDETERIETALSQTAKSSFRLLALPTWTDFCIRSTESQV